MQNKSQGNAKKWDSEAHKMLSKEDQVVRGCIDGLRTTEDCNRWIEAEIQHQQRKEVIGLLNQRKDQLENE